MSTAPEHELPPDEPRSALVRSLTSSLVLELISPQELTTLRATSMTFTMDFPSAVPEATATTSALIQHL